MFRSSHNNLEAEEFKEWCKRNTSDEYELKSGEFNKIYEALFSEAVMVQSKKSMESNLWFCRIALGLSNDTSVETSMNPNDTV